MTSTADFVNDNYAILVSKFDESTTLGDSVYDIFEKNDDIITEYSIVWVNTYEKNRRDGSLKFFFVTFHRIPII